MLSSGKMRFFVPQSTNQIPRSYLILQETVKAEKQRRAAEREVQYLTDSQLESIIEQNPGSDIRDYEDLQTGTVTFYFFNISKYLVIFKQYMFSSV